jgi:hypothetical protein
MNYTFNFYDIISVIFVHELTEHLYNNITVNITIQL